MTDYLFKYIALSVAVFANIIVVVRVIFANSRCVSWYIQKHQSNKFLFNFLTFMVYAAVAILAWVFLQMGVTSVWDDVLVFLRQ